MPIHTDSRWFDVAVAPWHVTGSLTRHNGGVWGRRSQEKDMLRHLLVAGGSVDEWSGFSESQWKNRLDDLMTVARRGGASFVTVHPHEPDGADPRTSTASSTLAALRRTVVCDGVRIEVDPVVDGRDRILGVVSKWDDSRRLTEKRLSTALFGDAGEPDLVAVLGPGNRLPRSLVWELAYGELVFIPVAWDELTIDHLRTAVDDFARRQRRFGGVE